ncbi:hypothetical protein MLD38_018525 [Melastoma candidum]|uniref:Uncharacterized protein n=1 Tax=Melastoma candidum TaxID=119954 RepID=A0ACB9R2D2_9MYRT|nr:hypothetical protein MLD38_018525 [Melastoma candidum]
MILNFTLQTIRNSPPPPPSPVVALSTPFPFRISQPFPSRKSTLQLTPHAKFSLDELLGGRGLCNGEEGLQQELDRPTLLSSTPSSDDNDKGTSSPVVATDVPEDAFEKEFMGLTGGFPGGEKGLELFLKKNPPPLKKKTMMGDSDDVVKLMKGKKPRAPELPLLMPGMIAIVKNPNNPFYMYCGIVQRITDGKAAVLFEGGIWDRLATFRLEELERREKGPPMKNPKSAILEQLIQQKS